MQTNNQKKLKNKIFIIWGLFISGVILVILIILLLAMNPQLKTDTQNQPTLTSKTNSQQEQETYNRIVKETQKEIDKQTQLQVQTPSLKYPPEIDYFNDGKIIRSIKEYDQNTGIMTKLTCFYDDGKIIRQIDEYNGFNLIKETFFNPEGTIKETKTY
ncbi:DUF2963 domain-containing protein [Candidatus Phytoplasma tritici]|uniref:DUF2963 domain-containing protein n=1 Tax=Candidatus Phytoplasma tritici TaxID=321961 RepID=UPI0004239CDA|nr:DUF2963 domain-containing protein [Candidatus Phytoplasma tritici]